MSKETIESVKQFVTGLFLEKHDKKATYHTIDHTSEVASSVEKIGKGADLNSDDLEMLVIAAWFHDSGYLFHREDHEVYSAKTAEEYLQKINYPAEKIKTITDCILATKMDHLPLNLMEEIIRDADYTNLSSSDNLKQAALLKQEMESYGVNKTTEEEWLTEELKFLINHSYHTAYARNKLQEKKEDNIKKIKKKLKKFRDSEKISPVIANAFNKEVGIVIEKEVDKNIEIINDSDNQKNDKKDNSKKDSDKKDIEKKEALALKEFDAIYKLVSTNHMRMNAMADRKANIMLTLNGIIISIIMSVVASNPDSSLRMIIPTSILILTCLTAIIFAALSTRPKVTSGTVTQESIDDKKANLLFFGNFSKMVYDDFDKGIRQMLTDQEYLHNSMIMDFYSLGKVLDTKYRYLRICYNVFMAGLVLSVIAITIFAFIGN